MKLKRRTYSLPSIPHQKLLALRIIFRNQLLDLTPLLRILMTEIQIDHINHRCIKRNQKETISIPQQRTYIKQRQRTLRQLNTTSNSHAQNSIGQLVVLLRFARLAQFIHELLRILRFVLLLLPVLGFLLFLARGGERVLERFDERVL